MDENEVKNQKIENQEITDVVEVAEPEIIEEVVFRHPQQLLTNKEIQNLILKKAKVDGENAEREKKGEEPIEGLSEVERGAISLYLLRAKSHHSKPKKLSSKERTTRKAKRKISKKSRKLNR